MSEQILNAYEFSNEELQLIDSNFASYHDWDKSIFDPVKKNIIDHLRIEQDNKCCYCKKVLGFDIKEVDIEHIVPKSEYQCFTFHNKNLALSCPACNTKKSTKSVLFKKHKEYPKSKRAFIINHAHYDKYSSNIRILDDIIYVAINAKGSDTIKFCELFRYLLVAENARKFYTKKSPLAELTEKIRIASENEVNDLLDAIKEKLNKN